MGASSARRGSGSFSHGTLRLRFTTTLYPWSAEYGSGELGVAWYRSAAYASLPTSLVMPLNRSCTMRFWALSFAVTGSYTQGKSISSYRRTWRLPWASPSGPLRATAARIARAAARLRARERS